MQTSQAIFTVFHAQKRMDGPKVGAFHGHFRMRFMISVQLKARTEQSQIMVDVGNGFVNKGPYCCWFKLMLRGFDIEATQYLEKK